MDIIANPTNEIVEQEQVVNRLLAIFSLPQLEKFCDAIEEIKSSSKYGSVTTIVTSCHVTRFVVEKSIKA